MSQCSFWKQFLRNCRESEYTIWHIRDTLLSFYYQENQILENSLIIKDVALHNPAQNTTRLQEVFNHYHNNKFRGADSVESQTKPMFLSKAEKKVEKKNEGMCQSFHTSSFDSNYSMPSGY